MSTAEQSLPLPKDELFFEKLSLNFVQLFPGDGHQGLVPYYHFLIRVAHTNVGHINLRVGDTDHVQQCAGHIGYEILPPFRGHGYAGQACRALAPFVRKIYSSVIVTVDPDNLPSIRTVEKLGANFLDEVNVPPYDPHYQRGSRRKKRYRWTP